jgi:hypothetical protein
MNRRDDGDEPWSGAIVGWGQRGRRVRRASQNSPVTRPVLLNVSRHSRRDRDVDVDVDVDRGRTRERERETERNVAEALGEI